MSAVRQITALFALNTGCTSCLSTTLDIHKLTVKNLIKRVNWSDRTSLRLIYHLPHCLRLAFSYRTFPLTLVHQINGNHWDWSSSERTCIYLHSSFPMWRPRSVTSGAVRIKGRFRNCFHMNSDCHHCFHYRTITVSLSPSGFWDSSLIQVRFKPIILANRGSMKSMKYDYSPK